MQYNPFAKHLETLGYINHQEAAIEIKAAELIKAAEISTEDKRKLTPTSKAFDFFMEDLKERTDNGNSISTYRGTIKWLSERLG
ncbi:hypothetical protein ACVWYN_001066 [Pedobacter sp. UYP24]